MTENPLEKPLDQFKDATHTGRPNEVAGCPTGLALEDPVEKKEGHEPLAVEKLEGRQETGRDAQDEAEKDLPE